MKAKMETYALIYFNDRPTIKRAYVTASAAFYAHEQSGCILVELFNKNGTKLASRKRLPNE